MRIAIWLSYDGEPFSGFARQNDQLTVQGSIEEALELLFHRPVETTCAGRTDAGVHALCQVVSFDLSEEEWFRRKPESLLKSLNALTHEAMSLREVRPMPDDFSARFSATAREYRYHICTDAAAPLLMRDFCWHLAKPLDVRQMEEAASYLLGEHDFKSFCMAASAKGKPTHRYVATVDLRQERIWDSNFVVITVVGNAFLHSMVRTMVGTLVLVGLGKRRSEWVKDVLQACDRQAAGQNAPAQGLVLWNVDYNEQHRYYDPQSHQKLDGAVLGGTVAELGEMASEEQLSDAIEDVPSEMLDEVLGVKALTQEQSDVLGASDPAQEQDSAGSDPSVGSEPAGGLDDSGDPDSLQDSEASNHTRRGFKSRRGKKAAKRAGETAAGSGGSPWLKWRQEREKDREFVIPRGPDLDAIRTGEMPVVVHPATSLDIPASDAVVPDEASQVASGATAAVTSFATLATAAAPTIDVVDAAVSNSASSAGADALPLVSDKAVQTMIEETQSLVDRTAQHADEPKESKASDFPTEPIALVVPSAPAVSSGSTESDEPLVLAASVEQAPSPAAAEPIVLPEPIVSSTPTGTVLSAAGARARRRARENV